MKSRTMKTVLAIGAAMFLAACGSGGSSSSGPSSPSAASALIKGCACAGAPVVGFVEVRDSSTNPQPVKTNIPILADGIYSVDVNGLQPPFAFLAVGTVGGRTVLLYSAATKEDIGGTINITPFTDLMIRNIAASAVDAYVNQGRFSALTAAQLDAQRVTLTNQLAPALTAMGLSGSIDLLRATFNADGKGLDSFMDVVKVSTTPTTATITNILDAAKTLIINTTTGTYSGTLGTGGLDAFNQIRQQFQKLSIFFATSLPSPTDTNLLALFSSTFLDDGQNLSAFLTDITTSKNNIGLKLSNIVVDSLDTAAGTAQVHFSPLNAAGICLVHDQVGCALSWQVVRNSIGVWQANGNQRIARVRVETQANQQFCPTCSPTGSRATGLNLNIKNQGLLPIGLAVVTGPGLPTGGVTLTAQANSEQLMFPSAACQGCTTNFFIMTDVQIKTVASNSTYTVTLFNTAPTPGLMATYTEILPVPPVLNLALPGLAFPTITNRQNLAGITTATLTPAWQVPAGLFGDIVSVFMNQSSPLGQNVQNLNVRADLTGMTATSGTSTLVITAPTTGSWTNGGYFIGAFDQYGGLVNTNYQP